MPKGKHRKQRICAAGRATPRCVSSVLPQNITERLGKLESGSTIAVVTLFGSLCPVTTSHVQAFVEARRFLLGEEEEEDGRGSATESVTGGGGDNFDRRSAGLETFHEVLGFVALNSETYVRRKFERKGEVLPLEYEERVHLVRLATEDIPWIGVEDSEGEMYHEMKGRWPRLEFVHFSMNGADDVLRYRKWHGTGPDNRILMRGRPGHTQQVREMSLKYGVNPNYFLLGPELPDVSSTEARLALERRDHEALGRILDPKVSKWCLEHKNWNSSTH